MSFVHFCQSQIHVFTIQHQNQVIRDLKIIHINFSENYTGKYANPIQSAGFKASPVQATMHTPWCALYWHMHSSTLPITGIPPSPSPAQDFPQTMDRPSVTFPLLRNLWKIPRKRFWKRPIQHTACVSEGASNSPFTDIRLLGIPHFQLVIRTRRYATRLWAPIRQDAVLLCAAVH